jgi:hypothetical protein
MRYNIAMTNQLTEKTMQRESMIQLFGIMGGIAAERGQQFEIAVFGGSALALSFD